MSLDQLRKLMRGEYAKDIEQLRRNMRELIELQREIKSLLERIEKCLCKGQ